MLTEELKEVLTYCYNNISTLPELDFLPGDSDETGFLTIVVNSLVMAGYQEGEFDQALVNECVMHLVNLLVEDMILNGTVEVADFDGEDFRYQLTPEARRQYIRTQETKSDAKVNEEGNAFNEGMS